MKKNAILLGAIMISSFAFAQVGLNTATPNSTLDVVAKNTTGTTTNVDGLLVPRVDRQRAQSMASVPVSTLIYVTSAATGTQTGNAVNIDTPGYYYFDETNVWTKMKAPAGAAAADINIYKDDGTLTSNRTVTQADKTLAFTSTATNGFSVDGSTFSVDAANNRVGIGTTAPSEGLTVTDATNANQYQGTASFYANNLTQGVGIGYAGIQSVGSNPTVNLNLNAKNTGNVLLQTQSTGNVGIGVTAPTSKLHVNGSVKITDGTQGAGKIFVSDANGLGSWQSPSQTKEILALRNNTTQRVLNGTAAGATTALTNFTQQVNTISGAVFAGSNVFIPQGTYEINVTFEFVDDGSAACPPQGFLLNSYFIDFLNTGRIHANSPSVCGGLNVNSGMWTTTVIVPAGGQNWGLHIGRGQGGNYGGFADLGTTSTILIKKIL